jgi:hypothetical protein
VQCDDVPWRIFLRDIRLISKVNFRTEWLDTNISYLSLNKTRKMVAGSTIPGAHPCEHVLRDFWHVNNLRIHWQGLSFIATPSTVALSHRKPSSAETSCDSCGDHDNKKRNILPRSRDTPFSAGLCFEVQNCYTEQPRWCADTKVHFLLLVTQSQTTLRFVMRTQATGFGSKKSSYCETWVVRFAPPFSLSVHQGYG